MGYFIAPINTSSGWGALTYYIVKFSAITPRPVSIEQPPSLRHNLPDPPPPPRTEFKNDVSSALIKNGKCLMSILFS